MRAVECMSIVLPLPLSNAFACSIPRKVRRGIITNVHILIPLKGDGGCVTVMTSMRSRGPSFGYGPVRTILSSCPSLLPRRCHL